MQHHSKPPVPPKAGQTIPIVTTHTIIRNEKP
jgi:hypothetical protein